MPSDHRHASAPESVGAAGARVASARRHAWSGPSLLVTDPRGECGAHDALTGYYFRETRHLRSLRLLVDGAPAWVCAEGQPDDRRLAFVLVHPELTEFGGGGTGLSGDEPWRDARGVAARAIDLRVLHELRPDGMVAGLTLANRSRDTVELEVAWVVDADFADLQEALADARRQAAPVRATADGASLTLRYAHDRLPLATVVRAEPVAGGGGAAWRATGDRLVARVTLAPQESSSMRLVVSPLDAERPAGDGAARLAVVARWRERLPAVHTPGDTSIGELVRQAAHDLGSLALLDGAEDEWLAVQAGIPLYPALFGRDAITTGWQAAMLDQGALLDAALTRLGRMQSDRTFDPTDEEPGRIPQQVRAGPIARLGLEPFAAYYADFASPLMFVVALAHHFAWRGDRATLRRHWDTARRVLDWARERGDADGDGYLEYHTRSPAGPKNQGWKDSGNAILYEDGRPVPAPLGTCDLQGYWFAAQQLMAALSWVMGARDDARDLWRSARELRERFNRDWWVEEEGFFGLALDPEKRLVRVPTSNVGQCLATGIVSAAHMPRVVKRLFAADLFSGWGVRTLSTAHPSYSPLDYHLGSVWPVENATILLGLRRFGFDQEAERLAGAMLDLARLFERGRVPECVGGYARHEFPHPGAYPRANPLQAWNQSALVLVLQTMLGLQPVAMLHTLFVDPALPPWLPEVVVGGLRLGEGRATIRFWRDEGGASHAEVVEKEGPFHLVRQPPPESLAAGVTDRIGALFETLAHH